MEKVPCRQCGAMILPATAERNEGLCSPCKQNSRERSPEFDTSISEEEIIGVQKDVYSRIGQTLVSHGFRSDDDLRYLRAIGSVIHYFVFRPIKRNYANNRGLIDGIHLDAMYGEELIYADGFRIQSPLESGYRVPSGYKQIRVGRYDVVPWQTKDQKVRGARRYLEAATEICANRFNRLETEAEYSACVLGQIPSLTNVYLLSRAGLHDEANAWLYLLTHKYAGLRTISGAYPKGKFTTYIDQPGPDLQKFSQLGIEERISWIQSISERNLTSNGLGWLYEGA